MPSLQSNNEVFGHFKSFFDRPCSFSAGTVLSPRESIKHRAKEADALKERFYSEGWVELPPHKPPMPPKFVKTMRGVHIKALRLCEELNRRPKHKGHLSGRPSAWGDMMHFEDKPMPRRSVTQGGRRRGRD